MTRPLRIGTRGSALARWQSDFVASRLKSVAADLPIEVVEITSTGDQVLDQPLWQVEGTGFFTAAIERALVDRTVDIAVHSYKDLPVDSTPGLVVAAVPERAPVEDVLCATHGLTLAMLPRGARVGTCSARRTAQLRALRPDLTIVPLRGNVPTRVARVTDGDLDAIVLARAGLLRLGLERHITEIFTPDHVLPAPAQGALAIQCRAEDSSVIARVAMLDDADTRHAVLAERTVLHALGGGCSVPVGAHAQRTADGFTLATGVFSLDGLSAVRAQVSGPDPAAVGTQAAQRLVALGAEPILAAFDKEVRLEAPITTGGRS